LRHAGLDVRAGRRDLRLPAPVAARAVHRPVAREVDDVVDVVGAAVADAAAVGAGLPVVLPRRDGDHVLGRGRRAHRVGARAVVAGREDDHVLLVAGRPRPRVAHDLVVGLRLALVVGDRGLELVDEGPGVRADARAGVVGRALPARLGRRAAAEDGRAADLRPGRDAQAVVVEARVDQGRARAVVEARDDLRVQEAVAGLAAALARR